ncbi:MAG: hypothetical protein PF480_02875 [Roseovarius sp.]|nr:hypothetical protein [Roseovarius sp.]
MTGLIIKAQAMQAWETVEPLYRSTNVDAQAWAEAMTATVLRQAAQRLHQIGKGRAGFARLFYVWIYAS